MAFTLKNIEPYFPARAKLPIHLAQLVLVIVVIALSGARLLMKNTPPGRSTTMGLGMGAKSIVIIMYQLLTEHVNRLKKWGSLKAYWILNAMEVVFWAAVAFMMIQGNRRICIGTSCAIGWVVCVLGICLSIMAKYVTVVGFLDWRYFKDNGVPRESKLEKTEEESMTTIRKNRK
ncbi:hypothetical protein CEP52_014991 [Fusarium oligoseptatum]|uniref:MARVEL domain-containing protein n=2 Tax=Fusarium solani species complex TaxID=232080 RepID=A0A428SHA0_9HYPO|nr:hypothetical protein CEP51_002674 [Fusarium floridanum]RSL89139.1 hypothetical protein CEP52_014991 [Fusarium oligoseptatum]